jgi:hypothetical protein
MTLISKQLRKDTSFNRCDSIMKEIIEDFCQCFQTTVPLMNCTSPIRVRHLPFLLLSILSFCFI